MGVEEEQAEDIIPNMAPFVIIKGQKIIMDQDNIVPSSDPGAACPHERRLRDKLVGLSAGFYLIPPIYLICLLAFTEAQHSYYPRVQKRCCMIYIPMWIVQAVLCFIADYLYPDPKDASKQCCCPYWHTVDRISATFVLLLGF